MSKFQEDRILLYIEEYLTEIKGIDEVACHFGYSTEYFRHMFRSRYGKPFASYLRHRKMLKAAADIQSGSSVSDVSWDYGYQTVSGFSKAFRKDMGFSPSKSAQYSFNA